MVVESLLGFLTPYLPNFLAIIVILVVTRILLASTSRILQLVYKHFSIPRGYYLTVKAFVRVVIYFLSVLLVLLSLPGVNQQVIAIVGIGLGLLVSLTSTTTIGNAVAGAILYLTRTVHEGDRVEIDGVLGDVVDFELLFVHIKTIKDEVVSIPSLRVLNNKIINYSKLDAFIVHVSVLLGYDLDPGLVEELLLKAVKSTEGILEDPKPFVLVWSLNDYNVEYEVNGYTDKPQFKVRIESEIRRNILYNFTSAGVQIMSPLHATILERSGSEKVMPKHLTHTDEVGHEKVQEDKTKEIVEAKHKIEEKKREDIKLKEN